MGVAITLADIAKRGLLGGGSGSTGGGSGGGGSSGGGTTGVSPKEVNFYDYDGTCVHAYTVAEAQALSEFPAGPEHPGLVFQGWNWSLEGVKGLTRAMNIGAMYTTDDGTTRLYITLQEGRTSPMLGVGVNGTVTVDWGDGTEPDVLTGTAIWSAKYTPNHAYAAPGDYVIRMSVDGEMSFMGSSSSNQYACILRHSISADARNATYHSFVKRVELGRGIKQLNDNAFYNLICLETVTMPKEVESIGESLFQNCKRLLFVTIPDGVEELGERTFYASNIQGMSIPASLTTIGKSAFYSSAIVSVAIPDGVTSCGTSLFQTCNRLEKGNIPMGLTASPGQMFYSCTALSEVNIPEEITNITNGFCYGAKSLTRLVFQGDVTTIGSTDVFSQCTGMACYDFTACTAVPTLSGTNAFTGIPEDCEIRVPAALYDEWIAATNWATYAANIKAY